MDSLHFFTESCVRVYGDYNNAKFSFHESSLSRVLEHSKRGYIALSAFLLEETPKENLRRHASLKRDLKAAGLGFFELDGVYTYQDSGKTASEISVFVPLAPGMNLDYLIEKGKHLARIYDQSSIMVGYPDGTAVWMSPDGDVMKRFDTLRFNQPVEFYSKLRQGRNRGERKFSMDSVGVRQPGTHVMASLMAGEGVLY